MAHFSFQNWADGCLWKDSSDVCLLWCLTGISWFYGRILVSFVCSYLIPVSIPLYRFISGKIYIKYHMDSKPLTFVLSIKWTSNLLYLNYVQKSLLWWFLIVAGVWLQFQNTVKSFCLERQIIFSKNSIYSGVSYHWCLWCRCYNRGYNNSGSSSSADSIIVKDQMRFTPSELAAFAQ